MTAHQAIAELIEIQSYTDTEHAHVEADRVLCDFIDALPDPDGSIADMMHQYRAVHKWFA
jgi:hypothetical protein